MRQTLKGVPIDPPNINFHERNKECGVEAFANVGLRAT